jgi:hypothetical protein
LGAFPPPADEAAGQTTNKAKATSTGVFDTRKSTMIHWSPKA